MNNESGAVFLSYASEDAEAASRIADTLRSSGIEVWFDQSELRGGDAWDAAIRGQIRGCALFVPILSTNTIARVEGYFRFEWKLAIDRSHLIAPEQPFLMPVVLDQTQQSDAGIPERFREVQWTRAPGGNLSPEFVERALHLLARRNPRATPSAAPRAASTMPQAPAASGEPVRSSRIASRSLTRLLASVLVVLLIAAIARWLLPRTGIVNSASAPTRAALPVRSPLLQKALPAAAPAAPRASVAVLPFVNLTGDPGKDYFGDGMAEELIDALTQVPNLKVPARTSSFAYRGRNLDIRAIARELGVSTIIEGSVRSAAGRIRVTAQLVDAANGYDLWSKSYDRKFADIFKLQDELAGAIVQALQASMGLTGALAVHAPPTQDVEAYQLYLQGRALDASANFMGAITLFDQALARDPNFASALAFRAADRMQIGQMASGQQDAQRALVLDPHLSYAHGALAILSAVHGDWIQSQAQWRAALAIAPGDGLIRASYALAVLAPSGRLREALAEGLTASQYGPANAFIAAALARLYSGLGRDPEALEYGARAASFGYAPIPLLPRIRADAALRRGAYPEAAEQFNSILPAPMQAAGAADVTRLVFAARSGPDNRRRALQAMIELTQRLRTSNSEVQNAGMLVSYYVFLGDFDAAYGIAMEAADRLGRADLLGTVGWSFIWSPEMRAFRADPRFAALVKRLNLIGYWNRYGPPDGCKLQGEVLTCG